MENVLKLWDNYVAATRPTDQAYALFSLGLGMEELRETAEQEKEARQERSS